MVFPSPECGEPVFCCLTALLSSRSEVPRKSRTEILDIAQRVSPIERGNSYGLLR